MLLVRSKFLFHLGSKSIRICMFFNSNSVGKWMHGYTSALFAVVTIIHVVQWEILLLLCVVSVWLSLRFVQEFETFRPFNEQDEFLYFISRKFELMKKQDDVFSFFKNFAVLECNLLQLYFALCVQVAHLHLHPHTSRVIGETNVHFYRASLPPSSNMVSVQRLHQNTVLLWCE